MTQRKKILAISGSTRTNSTNEILLKAIAEKYSETLDVHIFKELAELPHFNPDVDDDNIAQSVKDFRERVLKADGIIICTPEYVFSLPGSLKNAIEWTVSTVVFSDKPTALIVASASGAKAFESLILIMKTLGAKFAEDSTLLIWGARSKVKSVSDISEETMLEIDRLVNSFKESID